MARQPITFGKNLSDDIKDFIRKCLTIEEAARINIAEMENHAFIKRILNDGYMDEYQSAPPLLNKISSNVENKEPVEIKATGKTDERKTKEDKAVTSQIFFMRYMYRLAELLPKGKLHFIVLKQLISTLETLKTILDQKNPFNLDNWDEFLTNDKTKKIQQVITEYAKKYSKIYPELDEYVTKGTKDRRFALYLDRNYQRSETLAVGAVHYCL